MTAAPASAPARRRRVWPWVLLAVVVLLVALAVVAEFVARSVVRDEVAARLSDALEVDAAAVEVDLGDGILLSQLVRGGVDAAQVTVDDLALGPLEGRLEIDARGIPLDAAEPTRELAVSYTVPEDVLERVVMESTSVEVDSLVLEQPELVATGQVEIFGSTLELGVGITPTARDGAVVFTPTSVRIADSTLDVADLADNPVFGGLAGMVGAGFEVCIAQELPAALVLTDVAVEGSSLVARFDGSGEALGGEAYRSRGACG